MARELDPAIRHIHVHYLHTPASVVRYAALLTGRTFSFSAHAKDIWTTPAWEKREKIADAAFGVTCTQAGLAELRGGGRRGDRPASRSSITGSTSAVSRLRRSAPSARRRATRRSRRDPVGRAAPWPRRATGTCCRRWPCSRPTCTGGSCTSGPASLRDALKRQAERLGLADRIEWRGGQAQDAVIAAMREADCSCCPAPRATRATATACPT